MTERLTNPTPDPRLELGGKFMPDETNPETRSGAEEDAHRADAATDTDGGAGRGGGKRWDDPPTEEEREKRRREREEYFKSLPEGERKEKALRDKLLLESREARDAYFDRFFNLIDQTPHEFFDQTFGRNLRKIYEYEDFIELINRAAIGENDFEYDLDKKEFSKDLIRYQAERRMRQSLHDVNAAIYITSLKAKQLYEHVQSFDSELADLAWRTPGALQMANIYEQVLREDMAKNGGYLRPEAVKGKVDTMKTPGGKEVIVNVERGAVEEEARRRFVQMVEKGEVVMRDDKGKPYVLTREDFQEWQIDKAFTIARGMSIVNLRLISLAAESRLPKESGRYTSLFLQDIISSYSPFVHLLGKFQIAGKGMAPYLYRDEKRSKMLGLFSKWDPISMKEVLRKYEKEGLRAIQDSPWFFYIQKLNPNRAGDIFTWLSWRASDDDSVASMMQRFVERGKKEMGVRWDKKHGVKAEEYERIIRKYELLKKEFKDENDSEEVRKGKEDKLKEDRKKEWASKHAGADSVEDYEKFVEEYSNWIGTGLRFERLRGNLEKLDPNKSWEENRKEWEAKKTKGKGLKETTEEYLDRIDEAKKVVADMDKVDGGGKGNGLFEVMARLQPHRLYLKSPEIRKRINKILGIPEDELTPEQDEKITRILSNLSLVEAELLKNREKYLDEGKKFDELSLDFSVIKNESERKEAEGFAELVRKDFKDNTGKYYEEFVTRREYRHGYVLWDGDAPKDEFNFTALGPTGVVRRARDNQSNEEAWTEEIKLLDSIEHIKTPDQLIELLEKIHKKVDDFDKAKAMLATAEKAEAFAQFFAESSFTKFPVFGLIERVFGDKVSMAKMVFGKEAAAWGSTELRYFFEQLKSRQLINEEQYKKLYDKFATMPDIIADVGVSWFQFLMILLAMYIIGKLLKEK